MIYRTNNPTLIAMATKGHHGDDFIPEVWAEDGRNIALVTDKGDINLFQYQAEGTYVGHFFYISRGKNAVRVANDMLDAIFKYDDVQVILGLTPVDKLGAKWLARKIGFKSHGEIDTPPGRCELFVMSRSDYEKDKA